MIKFISAPQQGVILTAQKQLTSLPLDDPIWTV